jgi:ubiquinone/menaquinone biosynthesis C-methylase UbiE
MRSKETSWGNVADWYAEHVESEDSYHRKVILPNLLRLMNLKPTTSVVDIASGSGFFANEFSKLGAIVQGIDISQELVALATKNFSTVSFKVAPAHSFPHIADASIDVITIILAIQNIAEVKDMLAECRRVLRDNSTIYIVMNHPSFRIPGGSSWQWDNGIMYRRVDEYLSEKRISIAMHPGAKPHEKTISFHRPLQYYMKLIGNGGFALSRLEEWISHRQSEKGPRQKEEDRMRKEIPLFMILELVKNPML